MRKMERQSFSRFTHPSERNLFKVTNKNQTSDDKLPYFADLTDYPHSALFRESARHSPEPSP